MTRSRHHDKIARTSTGSIDYSYYDRRARHLRSEFMFKFFFLRTVDDSSSSTSRCKPDDAHAVQKLATCA